MAARPSMAPHLSAQMSRRDRRQQGAASVKQLQSPELESSKMSSDAKNVQKLRRMVTMALEVDPSPFQGEVKFGAVQSAVETHCGMGKSQFVHFLTKGFGIQSPADAIRLHCADLVTIKGSGHAVRMRDDPDWDPPSNSKKRSCKEYNETNKEIKLSKRAKRKLSLGSEGYVEILKEVKCLSLGDVLKVVCSSNSGYSLKVAALVPKTGKVALKALPKKWEGCVWRWAARPEDGMADALARQAAREHEQRCDEKLARKYRRKCEEMADGCEDEEAASFSDSLDDDIAESAQDKMEEDDTWQELLETMDEWADK